MISFAIFFILILLMRNEANKLQISEVACAG